jgi:hypothetical protein
MQLLTRFNNTYALHSNFIFPYPSSSGPNRIHLQKFHNILEVFQVKFSVKHNYYLKIKYILQNKMNILLRGSFIVCKI